MKGALFDLDGVLIDTEPLYTEFWTAIGHDYGLSPTFAADIKGTNLKSILLHFEEQAREVVEQRIHDFEDNMRYVFFPGARELLAEMKRRSIRMAIVTSSDDVKMGYLYAQHPGFREMFDAVIDGSMVTRSKPDPEGYILASKAIGCEPSECVVFEDSLQGLEAGRRSGAFVVGIATTNPRSAVEALADLTIDEIGNFILE